MPRCEIYSRAARRPEIKIPAKNGRYTNLVLSLLYPDRDWKDVVFHEDHIFPQSEFQVRALKKRGYDEVKVHFYVSRYNILSNLQLLTESENLSKNATSFDEWIQTRDDAFADGT